ncbi:hypothetical protein NPIL_500161 [Nephila pilipes]|uniref:Uncharacterized protein n=1 Tax=Nephila pilipes TaxID=299642 RepID=A0A8X6PKY0_NEPPI|nr:hypothetical protein NPIL_500161 [Nephila pilipes]
MPYKRMPAQSRRNILNSTGVLRSNSLHTPVMLSRGSQHIRSHYLGALSRPLCSSWWKNKILSPPCGHGMLMQFSHRLSRSSSLKFCVICVDYIYLILKYACYSLDLLRSLSADNRRVLFLELGVSVIAVVLSPMALCLRPLGD